MTDTFRKTKNCRKHALVTYATSTLDLIKLDFLKRFASGGGSI